MAIYSLNMHSVKVGKSSAVSRSAYVSASEIKSERTGITANYTKKQDVKFTEFMLPKNCPAFTREQFWNKVEEDITQQDHCYAKTGHIALPKEWTDEEKIEYARMFLEQEFVSKGHVVDWAFHDEKGNPHIDYLVSQKRINAKGKFMAPKTKEVFANDRDEDGKPFFNPDKPSYDPKNKEATEAYRLPVIDKKTGEQKIRIREGKGAEKLWEKVKIEDESLNSKDFLLKLRKSWEVFANERLQPEQHIDCRSLKAQGIDREPQIHMGPGACAIEDKMPGKSDRVKRNQKIIENNDKINQLKTAEVKIGEEIVVVKLTLIQRIKEAFKRSWERLRTSKTAEPYKDIQAWRPTEKDRQKAIERQERKEPWFLKPKNKSNDPGLDR